MAQYYQLSNPRAKGVLAFSGQLSTILFDGSPGELVSLLLVPPKPALKAPSPPAAPAIPEAPTELRIRNSSSRVDAESRSQSATSVAVGS
ncbi:hypothetical protein O988_06401 [Pseudogymnoascus sp. VKM F-3808]|nr:hypothetical protein O988_06401 [Pseudogymnoascus sp. VKM F-3808]